MMTETDPASEFIERLGLAAEADGLPRIAGRLIGLLMLQDEPLSFEEIARRLKVSRASVSSNSRLLEARGMIERLTLPGDRRDYFRIGDDLHGSLLVRALERMRRMQDIASQFAHALPADLRAGRARLQAMDRFYRIVMRSTEAVLKEWYDGGIEKLPVDERETEAVVR